MKKTLNITLTLIGIVLIGFLTFTYFDISLQGTKIDSDSLNSEQNSDIIQKKRTQYKREWIGYDYADMNIKEEFEIYISDDNDTIFQQSKVYKNNILDSTRSNFYKLELQKKDKNLYKGKITLYSKLDYNIKSPLIEKTLGLSFIHIKRDTSKVHDFESKNKNYVEFEFESESDTLIGILYEQRLIDTIINGKKMVRFIEVIYPIDNKPITDNPFIEGFNLNKNKR